MSIQLVKANRYIFEVSTETDWPDELHTEQISKILTWHDGIEDRAWKDQIWMWCDALKVACKRGDLPFTTRIEKKFFKRSTGDWRHDLYGDAFNPIYEDITYSYITAPDLARWLAEQNQPPGALLKAWFKARGVGEAVKPETSPLVEEKNSAGHALQKGASGETKMAKAGLVKAYISRWPTIEADLGDASRNGLSVARDGNRGWDERKALEWGRSRGKLNMEGIAPTPEPADPMAAHFGPLSNLPSRKHRG